MANYVMLVNEAEQRVERVKVGFSWVCLFWLWLAALPLFVRRVYPWALGILALEILFYILDYHYNHDLYNYYYSCLTTNMGEFCTFNWHTLNSLNRWSGIVMFAFSLYLGFRGNEITARYYLKHGYKFAEPDSVVVKYAKTRWSMPL